MIIGSWNVRGLNSPYKRKEVRNFISKQKPIVMGLLETKIKERNLRKIVRRVRLDASVATSNSRSSEGRILYSGIILLLISKSFACHLRFFTVNVALCILSKSS